MSTEAAERPCGGRLPAPELPQAVYAWLFSLFHPEAVPSFEQDSVSVSTLCGLHSASCTASSLSALLDAQQRSAEDEYGQHSERLSSLLSALSLQPPPASSSPPAAPPSSPLACLTNVCLHLSLHSVDEAAMTAALVDRKEQRHSSSSSSSRLSSSPTQRLSRSQQSALGLLHETQQARAVLSSLACQADAVAADATQYAKDADQYAVKQREYAARTAAAAAAPGAGGGQCCVLEVLALGRELQLLESRLLRLNAEADAAAAGGLICELSGARRQVEEAELDVLRMQEDIERRLRDLS